MQAKEPDQIPVQSHILVRSFIWDFLGRSSTHIAGFVVTMILARLLAPESFGQVAIIMALVAAATVLSDGGFGAALIQTPFLEQRHFSSVFWVNTIIGMSLVVLFWCGAEHIANVFRQDELVQLTRALAFVFFLNAISAAHLAVLTRELKYSLIATSKLIGSVSGGGAGIFAAFADFGIWSLVVLHVVNASATCFCLCIVCRWRPTAEFSLRTIMELWSYGSRLLAAALLEAITVRLDILVMGRFSSISTVGMYDRAKSMNNLVVEYSSRSLVSVLFPYFSRIHHDMDAFRIRVRRFCGSISFVSLFITGTAFLAADILVLIALGDGWEESLNFFRFLIVASAGIPISGLMINILKARGKSSIVLRLQLVKKAIFAFSLFIIIYGSIAEYLYALIAISAFNLYLNIKYSIESIEMELKSIFRPYLVQYMIMVTAVILALICMKNTEANLIIQTILGVVVFSTTYFLASCTGQTYAYQCVADHWKVVYSRYFKQASEAVS